MEERNYSANFSSQAWRVVSASRFERRSRLRRIYDLSFRSFVFDCFRSIVLDLLSSSRTDSILSIDRSSPLCLYATTTLQCPNSLHYQDTRCSSSAFKQVHQPHRTVKRSDSIRVRSTKHEAFNRARSAQLPSKSNARSRP